MTLIFSKVLTSKTPCCKHTLTRFLEKRRWHNIKWVYENRLKYFNRSKLSLIGSLTNALFILSRQSFKSQHNALLDPIIEFFPGLCSSLMSMIYILILIKKEIQQLTVKDVHLQSTAYQFCHMEKYMKNYFKHYVIRVQPQAYF